MSEPRRKSKRRGNGEGSIFQRADGRWVAKLAIGYDRAGKRLRKTIYGHTKKDVQDELTKLQHRKSTGALTATSKVTVSQYLDRWLNDVVRLTVRPSTHRRYAELIATHVTPCIGGVRLHRLTSGDLQGIYSTMEQGGSSPRTRQFVHDVIRNALTNAVGWGLVQVNVCDQLTRPKVPKVKMKVLDARQAAILLNVAKSDRLSAMYTLAVTVGMRQGELFGLQWEDVDLEAGRLSVRHTLTDNGTLAQPKTPKSRRLIELPALAVDALWTHKAAMLAEGNARSPYVFCDTNGGPLRTQNVLRRSFRPILKAAEAALVDATRDDTAKFPAIRFHDLRHTAATLALQEGVHAKVVSEMLGHATVAFTLDTYAHVLPSMGKAAAAAMNRLFAVAT